MEGSVTSDLSWLKPFRFQDLAEAPDTFLSVSCLFFTSLRILHLSLVKSLRLLVSFGVTTSSSLWKLLQIQVNKFFIIPRGVHQEIQQPFEARVFRQRTGAHILLHGSGEVAPEPKQTELVIVTIRFAPAWIAQLKDQLHGAEGILVPRSSQKGK